MLDFSPRNYTIQNDDLKCLFEHNIMFPLHDHGLSIVNNSQENYVRKVENSSNLAMNMSDRDDENFEHTESNYGLHNQEDLENYAFDELSLCSPRKSGREDSHHEASTLKPSHNP